MSYRKYYLNSKIYTSAKAYMHTKLRTRISITFKLHYVHVDARNYIVEQPVFVKVMDNDLIKFSGN